MRNLVFLVAGLAIAGYGGWSYLQSDVRDGEVAVAATVVAVEEFERHDGRSFSVYTHTAEFADPTTGETRQVTSVRYRKRPPAVGAAVDVFVDAGTREPRAPAPASQRNGLMMIGFGALLVLVSLPAVFQLRSS